MGRTLFWKKSACAAVGSLGPSAQIGLIETNVTRNASFRMAEESATVGCEIGEGEHCHYTRAARHCHELQCMGVHSRSCAGDDRLKWGGLQLARKHWQNRGG